MLFSNISTMGNYMKTMQLQQKWQQRQQEGIQSPIKSGNKQVSQSMLEQLNDQQKSNYTKSLSDKLLAGASLSSFEMEYLRQNNPDLYKKAMELEKQRSEYAKQFDSAETKEEARMMHVNRVANYVARAKDAAAKNDFAASQAVQMEASFSHDAYKKFVESAKYAGLAENAAELQEAREAEKEEATGKTDEAQDVKETEKPEDVKPEEPNTEENSTAEEAPAQSGEAPKTDVETDVKTASPEQKEAVKAASKKSSADAPNVQLHTADLDTNPKVSVSTFEARA